MSVRNFWTHEDDTRLIAARASGETWRQVATHFPDRTQNACATRHMLLKLRELRGDGPPPPPRPRVTRKPGKPRTRALKKCQAEPELSGAYGLLNATLALYKREARRRRTTPEAMRLVLNYSPAQIQRMAARA